MTMLLMSADCGSMLGAEFLFPELRTDVGLLPVDTIPDGGTPCWSLHSRLSSS